MSAGDTRSVPMCWTSRASRICAPITRPAIPRRCSTATSMISSPHLSNKGSEPSIMMTDKYNALTEEKDENAIIGERRAKLAALREEGVAFPNDFRPQHKAALLQEQYEK